MDRAGKLLVMHVFRFDCGPSSFPFLIQNLLKARSAAAAANNLLASQAGFDDDDDDTRSFLKKVQIQSNHYKLPHLPIRLSTFHHNLCIIYE